MRPFFSCNLAHLSLVADAFRRMAFNSIRRHRSIAPSTCAIIPVVAAAQHVADYVCASPSGVHCRTAIWQFTLLIPSLFFTISISARTPHF